MGQKVLSNRSSCLLTWTAPDVATPVRHTPSTASRDLVGGLLSSVIDLANFQAAAISLQGIQEAGISMMQVGVGGQ